MKLPSLQHVAAEAALVVRRFPLTLLCSFVLCVVGIYLQHLDYQEKQNTDWIFPVLSTAGLGLSLTLAVALTAERNQWRPPVRLVAQGVTVALLALWYVLVPADPDTVWGLRLGLLLLGFHLGVAAGPYLSELRRQADTPGFWRYNETLFLRILTAAVYSGVLYLGCALALLAIEKLFDVKLNHDWYGYLFTVLGTVFNTWFFLAGVPHDFEALEHDVPYPKGLKLFTQFVLLPLVVLYLGILYAYLGRIVVLWTLPKGWVSTLVLALAVAGIFALLLIHPIRHAAENTWMRTFARWFYGALFPLLALLAVAIGIRVRAYGITEERYFVLVLAGWLFCIATYFLVRRGQGIIWVPASLAVVALASAGGPWGAFAVAERSQLGQLREISVQYKLLQNGKLEGAGQRVPELPVKIQQQLSSIFEFFADRNEVEPLQPLFATRLVLPDSLQGKVQWKQKSWLTDQLFSLSKLPRYNRYGNTEYEQSTLSFRAPDSEVQSLGSGRYWVSDIYAYAFDMEEQIRPMTLREGNFRLRIVGSGAQVILEQQRDNGQWQSQLVMSPGNLADSLAQQTNGKLGSSQELPANALTLRASNGRQTLQLYLQSLEYDKKQKYSYSFRGNALLEINPVP